MLPGRCDLERQSPVPDHDERGSGTLVEPGRQLGQNGLLPISMSSIAKPAIAVAWRTVTVSARNAGRIACNAGGWLSTKRYPATVAVGLNGGNGFGVALPATVIHRKS